MQGAGHSYSVVCGLIVVAIGTCAGPRASNPLRPDESRQVFLTKMDAALAARDPVRILALSDVAAWRESGHPPPDAASLVLPEGPIARERDLSESEVLYKDGKGRRWRLRLEYHAERRTWAAVLNDRPCPRGGMSRAPEWDKRSLEPERPTWTPLECWPLPR